MDLLATLSCFPAPDVLQWCGANRFDGHLAFRRGAHNVKLSCKGGRIIQVSSSERWESFGRHLFSQGLVDDLDLATATNHDPSARLGERLVELGVLTRQQVRVALVDHTLNLTCSIVQWKDGVVSAHAANLRPLSDIEPQPLDPFFVVMEAARRADELGRMRVFMPHDNVELGLSEDAELEGLSPCMLRTLDLFEPGDTIGRLAEKVGGSSWHLCNIPAWEWRGACHPCTGSGLDCHL